VPFSHFIREVSETEGRREGRVLNKQREGEHTPTLEKKTHKKEGQQPTYIGERKHAQCVG
jgi:hypothetical protein